MGADGLRAIGEQLAVLNANYVRARLQGHVPPAVRRAVHARGRLSATSSSDADGVKTLDIAKRLIDYGFHPPTIYFPLVVAEALMIEPTETETLEELDALRGRDAGDRARGGRRRRSW